VLIVEPVFTDVALDHERVYQLGRVPALAMAVDVEERVIVDVLTVAVVFVLAQVLFH